MFKFLLYAFITVAILASFGLIRGLPEENQFSYIAQEVSKWVQDTEQNVSKQKRDLEREIGL